MALRNAPYNVTWLSVGIDPVSGPERTNREKLDKASLFVAPGSFVYIQSVTPAMRRDSNVWASGAAMAILKTRIRSVFSGPFPIPTQAIQ
jgi:hypothetical protein